MAHGAAQSGLATVLLATLTPGGLDENVGRKWVGTIHGPLLDCPDENRRQWIEAEQIRWAAWLIDTSRWSPEEVARAIADWAEGQLGSEA